MNAFLNGLVPGDASGGLSGPSAPVPPSVASAAPPSVPGIDVPPVAESEGWLAGIGRQFSWWWILGLFGLALVVGGVWYFMRRRDTPAPKERERTKDRPRRKEQEPEPAPTTSFATGPAPSSAAPGKAEPRLTDRAKIIEARPGPADAFEDEDPPAEPPAPAPVAARTRSRRQGAPM